MGSTLRETPCVVQPIFTNTILAIIIIILTHGVPVIEERLPVRWREQSAVCRPQPWHAWTRSTGDTRAGGGTGAGNTVAGERGCKTHREGD